MQFQAFLDHYQARCTPVRTCLYLAIATFNSVSYRTCVNMSESKSVHKSSSYVRNAKLLNCGIISGLIQAGVFNPWDRALYLSVMHHRPFLRAENFVNPMAGVMQTITQRAISSGLYFPLEDIFSELISKHYNQPDNAGMQRTIRFVAGLLAGLTNGIILNPFSSVKVCCSVMLRC